jgi:serine/threonine-protein kinase
MEPQTSFANRYTLIEKIGMGGFSEVWKATDQMAENAVVAIKIYAPERGMDQHGLKQFRREYAVVLNLNHPTLLTARHFDVWDERPYLVMPFIEGGSLQERLLEKGVMDEESLGGLMAQLTSGLEYLHGKDILHQDIKPDNILIDTDGSYLLTDFGISGRLRSTLRKHTGSSNSMTLAYAPPERFSANPENIEASDIFSLGVLVYELATGNVPWMGNGGISLNSGAEVPELPEHYSMRFRKLVESMMHPDPASRPTSGKLAEVTKKYAESGHWPEVNVKSASANPQGASAPSGGRKTQKFEAPSQKPAAGTPNKTVKYGKLSASPAQKKSPSKSIWLAVAVVLILFAGGGFYYMSLQNAQAEQLAQQQQENAEAVAALVEQADEAKTNDNLTAAVGFYQDALEILPEDENVTRLLSDVRDEIQRIEEEEAQQLAAEEEARRQELAAQREREEQRQQEAEEQRQRDLEERRSRPDITADPLQGTITLASGFTPDPWPQALQLQPDINLEDVGYYGYATSQPLINVAYEAADLPLVLTAESTADDLVMLVYAPDGEWYFNDDFGDLNPGLQFDSPQSGTYMIWVGGYEQTTDNAILNISEVVDTADEEEIVSDTAADGPNVGATPNYGDIELTSGFTPDPYTHSATAGGSYDTSEMGYGGFVSIAPDFDLYFTPGTYSLTIKAESSEDTILLINTPGGEWLYNDDFEGLNPAITIATPEDGLYNIWIGSYGSENVDATLIITEL